MIFFDNTRVKCLLTACLCVFSFILFGEVFSKKDTDWSYLVFAQRWPPAACLEIEHGKCDIPVGVDDWIIHGLWPSRKNGYPSFCNDSWPFELANVEPILSALRVKWPNIIADTTEISFWKHEWSKHGTCAASSENLDGELKYFKTTLGLHDSLNMYEILRNADILPTGERAYVLKTIENALEMQLQKKVKIFCTQHKKYKYFVLSTVYFCMDKNFELLDCNIPEEPSCNQTFVTYLPFSENSLLCPKQ